MTSNRSEARDAGVERTEAGRVPRRRRVATIVAAASMGSWVVLAAMPVMALIAALT